MAAKPRQLPLLTPILCNDGSTYFDDPFTINSSRVEKKVKGDNPTISISTMSGGKAATPMPKVAAWSKGLPQRAKSQPLMLASTNSYQGPIKVRQRSSVTSALELSTTPMMSLSGGPLLYKSLPMSVSRGRTTPSPDKLTSRSMFGKSAKSDELSSLRRKRNRLKMHRHENQISQSAHNSPKKVVVASSARKDGLTPLKRFRRAARLVKLLVTVSNVCRDLLVYAIKDEQWYEFCEKFLKDASAGGTPMRKDTFMTTIKNPLTKEYECLEFDASRFRHDYHSGSSLLTPEMKAIFSKRPGTRTPKEIEEAILCLKRLVPTFRTYTYEQQKRICQAVMYDRYFQERVILREKLPPDGVYFVLNGTLLESGERMPAPRLINPGDKFGEEDLKSGMVRQTNVVTKSSCDLLYLHKFDYEEIFELTVDLSDDPERVFDICRGEQLFMYYPIPELIKNPARWQVLKFKYGRLIAANSCETEFIYIIRAGEAKVIKYLETRSINVLQRRRRLQDELDSSDPFVNRKKLLNFVADNPMRSKKYKFNTDSARNLAADGVPIGNRIQQLSHVPQHSANQNEKKYRDDPTIIELPDTDAIIAKVLATTNDENLSVEEMSLESPQQIDSATLSHLKKLDKARAMTAPNPQNQPLLPKRPHTTKSVLKSVAEENDLYRERKATTSKEVPPFVQVDTLHAGASYGMRSLLPLGQQGEPTALISAGCEVIQINRKFFAKYLDENMCGIIALKSKVYPSEDELLKRLDVNIQWEEYCADVMCDYLDSKIIPFRGIVMA